MTVCDPFEAALGLRRGTNASVWDSLSSEAKLAALNYNKASLRDLVISGYEHEHLPAFNAHWQSIRNPLVEKHRADDQSFSLTYEFKQELKQALASSNRFTALLDDAALLIAKEQYVQTAECGHLPSVSERGPWMHVAADGGTLCMQCAVTASKRRMLSSDEWEGFITSDNTIVCLVGIYSQVFDEGVERTCITITDKSWSSNKRLYWKGTDITGKKWYGSAPFQGTSVLCKRYKNQ